MRSCGRRIDTRVMTKRIIMSISGVVLCGLSVGMFKHAALGVDPFQALMSGLAVVIPVRFGTLYVIVNILLLSFPLLLDRHKIGLATFINLFLLGYVVEFSQSLCARLLPLSDSAAGRSSLRRRLCPWPSLPLSTSRRIWASPPTTPSLWYGASGRAGSLSLSAVF